MDEKLKESNVKKTGPQEILLKEIYDFYKPSDTKDSFGRPRERINLKVFDAKAFKIDDGKLVTPVTKKDIALYISTFNIKDLSEFNNSLERKIMELEKSGVSGIEKVRNENGTLTKQILGYINIFVQQKKAEDAKNKAEDERKKKAYRVEMSKLDLNSADWRQYELAKDIIARPISSKTPTTMIMEVRDNETTVRDSGAPVPIKVYFDYIKKFNITNRQEFTDSINKNVKNLKESSVKGIVSFQNYTGYMAIILQENAAAEKRMANTDKFIKSLHSDSKPSKRTISVPGSKKFSWQQQNIADLKKEYSWYKGGTGTKKHPFVIDLSELSNAKTGIGSNKLEFELPIERYNVTIRVTLDQMSDKNIEQTSDAILGNSKLLLKRMTDFTPDEAPDVFLALLKEMRGAKITSSPLKKQQQNYVSSN